MKYTAQVYMTYFLYICTYFILNKMNDELLGVDNVSLKTKGVYIIEKRQNN